MIRKLAPGFLPLLVLAAGCASHPNKMFAVRAALADPEYSVDVSSAPFAEKYVTGSDKILFLSERARAYQLSGDLEKSSDDYLAAEAAYDELDEKPVVAITSVASGAASLVGNDLALPYEGNAHERLMLYQLDAFNHIARLDWNAARAVANNLKFFSEKERTRREERLKAAEEASSREGNKWDFRYEQLLGNAEFKGRMSAANELSSAMQDALQNGYAYYFAGFVGEMDGDFSSAEIAYRRAAQIAPSNEFAARDLRRMEARTGRSGPAADDGPPSNVVVFFEEGFAPELQAFTFSFTTLPVKHTGHKHSSAGIGGVSTGSGSSAAAVVPLPGLTGMSVKFTFPYYSKETLDAVPSSPLVLSEDGRTVAETQMVSDFRALAAKAFEERMPYVVTRAAFRTILKAGAAAVANEAARQRGNTWARIFVWLGGLFLTHGTEVADLRSWLLAPRYGQIARFRLEPGQHRLSFAHGGTTRTASVDVPEGGVLIVHAMSVPGRLEIEGTALDFE